MTPDCFDSTALPEGPPHLIDRLDAAIAYVEKWTFLFDMGDPQADVAYAAGVMDELISVAREARDLLDAEGFGR